MRQDSSKKQDQYFDKMLYCGGPLIIWEAITKGMQQFIPGNSYKKQEMPYYYNTNMGESLLLLNIVFERYEKRSFPWSKF